MTVDNRCPLLFERMDLSLQIGGLCPGPEVPEDIVPLKARAAVEKALRSSHKAEGALFFRRPASGCHEQATQRELCGSLQVATIGHTRRHLLPKEILGHAGWSPTPTTPISWNIQKDCQCNTVQNACRMSTVYPAVSTEGDAILDTMSWELVHKGEICSPSSLARLTRMKQPQYRIECAIRASWFLNTLSLEVLSENPPVCCTSHRSSFQHLDSWDLRVPPQPQVTSIVIHQ